MSLRRTIGSYLTEARIECLRILRMPAFAIPILILPLAFYYLLGVMMMDFRRGSASGPMASDLKVFVAFAVYGVTGPGLFGLGSLLASERQSGAFVLKRALPMPPAAYIIAKLLMSLFFGALIMGLLLAMGVMFGALKAAPLELLRFTFTMILGVLPACAIGLFIAAAFPPASAYALSNIAFIGMVMLAGLFYPLPGTLAAIKSAWPVYHVQQLGLLSIGADNTIDPVGHIAALAATTVLFAVLGAWRLSRA